MARPLTASQLVAAADAADAEADRLAVQTLALREQAATLRDLAAKASLTIGGNRSIVSSKVEANVSTQSRYVRQAASRTRSESEAKRLLLEAGWTDSRVAKLLKVGRSTVNAYYGGRRSIPDEHATKLAGPPWNVPRSAWPRIA